jgi:hypothetical protein
MRPICARCRREMLPVKNEFMVKDKPEGGFPSTYWYGDLYECPECKAQVVTGFGKGIPAECGEKLSDATTALEFVR